MLPKALQFCLLSSIVVCVLINSVASKGSIFTGGGLFSGCCPAALGTCSDGSSGTPCCGRSPCNWWCCNCGSCHGRRKRDVSGALEPTGWQKMDKDGNGHVDKEEAHLHLLAGSCGNYTEKIVDFEHNFKKFDKDGDGKLSYEEINSVH
ncbi:unnamed protein product [Orchesella dallaii]|uniref:EF-hand domain-containing protein n=1 Tax=Orchesella dallaii TaxID=48710 RepID=A0ABP1R945_9HEXA